MSNKFASALKKKEQDVTPSVTVSSTTDSVETVKSSSPTQSSLAPSRIGAKHIGGYFDPAVSKQLKRLVLEEDSSIQSLLAEALDMLFQSRGKPMIAQRSKEV
jgi:hypothetical protein